jgi:hypothetical protein
MNKRPNMSEKEPKPKVNRIEIILEMKFQRHDLLPVIERCDGDEEIN